MSMNRQERRDMHQRLKPKIKRIVELEKQIKAGVNREAAETEIGEIMNSLSLIEMLAVEDYIYSKKLL